MDLQGYLSETWAKKRKDKTTQTQTVAVKLEMTDIVGNERSK